MTTQRIAYGRVSSNQQDLNVQLDAFEKAGVDQVFMEKISGTKLQRPEFDKMMQALRKEDTLVCLRLDRLGRSARDLLNIASELEAKGVQLEVLEQNIDTKTPEGRLFFQMVAAFSEFERAIIVSRTREGLEAARARGRKGGRRPKLTPAQIKTIKKLYDDRELTVSEIAEQYQVTRPTIYRVIEQLQSSSKVA